jgi:hypothetical protein
MFLPVTVTIAAPPGDVTVRHVEGRIVEGVYRGHCSAALVREALALTPRILRDLPGANCLLDMRLVTGHDAASAVPGGALMKMARASGSERFALILPSDLLRMLVTATAFAAALPLKAFERREEALTYLRGGTPEPAGRQAGGPGSSPPLARRRSGR